MSLGQSLKNYASTRRIYGANRSSRLAFWFALVLIPFGVWGFWLHNLGNSALPQWLRIVLAVAAPLIWFVNSILLQEPAASSVADDYSHVIADLENIEKPRGGHGYDNALTSMRAVFIAHGEAFKKGYVAEPFENIHVYNLMCKILGLKPAKNDGDFEKVKGMLKN